MVEKNVFLDLGENRVKGIKFYGGFYGNIWTVLVMERRSEEYNEMGFLEFCAISV